MNQLFVDWSSRRIERQYRGARTVRFMDHMRPDSMARFQAEIADLTHKGYYPVKWGSGWLYTKGAMYEQPNR